jgi:flagellar biosynthesis protein FlhA
MVEAAVEHGEHSSHLTLAPQAIRELIERMRRAVANPDSPTSAVVGSGARYFFRQMAETSIPNLFFIAHNEIPPGVKVVSLGAIN